jgi:hypothetical protein
MDELPEDSAQLPEEQPASERLPRMESATISSHALSSRMHLKQLGWALLAWAIVLAAIWGVFLRKAPAPPVLHTQPPPALPTLDITSNVGFGTVTVNGVLQNAPPPLHLMMQIPPPYTVVINAPPFRPVSCQIGGTSGPPVPAGSGGDCSEAYRPAQPGGTEQTALFLDVAFTLDDLPPDQQSQVTALLPQAATASQNITVPAQSYIATNITPAGEIKTQRPAGALQATATYAPSTLFNQPGYSCKNFICYNIIGLAASSPGGNLWEISVPVALSWRFTNAAGAVVSSVSLPYAELLTLYLTYDQTQGWHAVMPTGATTVADQTQQLACADGVTMLQLQVVRLLSGEGWNATPLTSKGLEGCLLDLQQNTAEEGHFLWRFGVILAADDKAHTTIPSLPVAPPEEVAAISG